MLFLDGDAEPVKDYLANGYHRLLKVVRPSAYREDGTIEASQYRKYYLKAKGGSYRSIAHMRSQMTLEGITIKGGDE